MQQVAGRHSETRLFRKVKKRKSPVLKIKSVLLSISEKVNHCQRIVARLVICGVNMQRQNIRRIKYTTTKYPTTNYPKDKISDRQKDL